MIRIYYGDGSIVDADLSVGDAPPLNVQAIVCDDPDTSARNAGKLVIHNWDYYIIHRNGEVWGEKGEVDFIEHVLFTPHVKCFKGRNIAHEKFQTILRAAKAYAKDQGKSASKHRQEDGDYFEFSQRREVGK